MPVEEKAEASRSWHAWAGPPESLRRLAAKIETMIQPFKDEALVDRTMKKRESNQTSEDDGINDKGGTDSVVERLFAMEAEQWETSVRAENRRGSRTWSGSLDEILDAADHREIGSISLSCPGMLAGDRRVHVYFSKHGVSNEVESRDAVWARSAAEEIASEIEKDVPWWARLRAPYSFLFLAPGVMILIALALYPLWERTDRSLEGFLWLVVLLGWLLGVVLSFVAELLPGFEIVAPGSRATGSRWLAIVGMILGVIVFPLVLFTYNLIFR